MKLSDKVHDKGLQEMVADLEQELVQVKREAIEAAKLVETTSTYCLFLCNLIENERKDVIVFLSAALEALEANTFDRRKALLDDLLTFAQGDSEGEDELTHIPF